MQNRHDPLGMELDHLAVTAADLAAGRAHAEAALGVTMPPGGTHPAMGTHNRLLSLGPATYLEVIAPDPNAPAPARPRWFALDRADRPRLGAWIARVADLDAALAACPVDAGRATAMSRGALAWRIAIRDDGAPPLGGAFPVLIEWPDKTHPAGAMEDAGLRLERLEIATPEAGWLGPWLAGHLANPRVIVTGAPAPTLSARFTRPEDGGTVTLA